MEAEQATVALLKGFLDAFDGHDLDAIMGYFADECVFYMPRGAGRGNRFVGKPEVRAGLASGSKACQMSTRRSRHWVVR